MGIQIQTAESQVFQIVSNAEIYILTFINTTSVGDWGTLMHKCVTFACDQIGLTTLAGL